MAQPAMSKREREQHLQKMVQATHFDYDEVKLLQEIYGMIHTVKASGVDYLSRPAFRDILILCFVRFKKLFFFFLKEKKKKKQKGILFG